jgi:DNA-binding response OmpR family regulator
MAEVIVVDDEQDISDMVEFMLTHRGWSVKHARNRRVALQMIREDPEIHIILLDYNMPDMRPDDFLEKVRQLHPQPKVILLTAAHRVAERARTLGIDHYIPKPFDPADVYNTVEQCLASQAS